MFSTIIIRTKPKLMSIKYISNKNGTQIKSFPKKKMMYEYNSKENK